MKAELPGGLNHINDMTKTFLLAKLSEVDAEVIDNVGSECIG